VIGNKFFKRHEKVFNKLSVKHSVTIPQIKEMLEFFFKDLKESIESPMMPSIKIKGLGSFVPSLGRIKERFRMKFIHFRLGNISRENISEFIRFHWPAYNRLKEEHNKKNTWSFWKKVNKDEYPESFYKLKDEQARNETD
jgi:hypothetical protein